MIPTVITEETANVTRPLVAQAAFELVCEQGLDKLSFESIASRLECDTETVSSLFPSLDGLESIIRLKAREHYDSYIEKGFSMNPPFKGYAIENLWFAMDEPHLYRMLFLSDKYESIDRMIEDEGNCERLVSCVMDTFHLSREQAYSVYRSLKFTMVGMSMSIVNGLCDLTVEQAALIYGKLCRGLVMEAKAGEDRREGYVPSEGSGPSGDVSEYIDKGIARMRSRQNAALLADLVSQNRILKSLHLEAHYIRDTEWVEIFRLLEVGFGISRQSLLKQYPFLSSSDVRIIALCKLGFGIGACSSMLGISPASVTKARQRLKGKVRKDSVEEFVAGL